MEDIHKAFGRGTAAGRALFLIYNRGKVDYEPGVAVPVAPNPVDPEEDHRQKRLEQVRPAVERRLLAEKTVPQVARSKQAPKQPKQVPFFDRGEGRKPASRIPKPQAERAPSGRKYPSREFQVKQLQKSMAGKDQGEDSESRLVRAGQQVDRSGAAAEHETEDRFEQLEREIEERRVFLEEMRAINRRAEGQVRDVVLAEIAARVEEMRRLEL